MKVCIEDGCWVATANTRCVEHERARQKVRNAARGTGRTRHAPYRKTIIVGVCACCGTDQDLTRHHVVPLAGLADVVRTGSVGPLVPMCRSCNSSIGARRMADHRCPQHGGEILR